MAMTMYSDFYHFKKRPFHITPDPEFLFLSPSHKQALASIIYGVEERKGFVAVIGEVGVGKTTVLRSYLESVDKSRMKIIYTFNPDLSFEGVLKLLCQELGIENPKLDTFEMIDALHHKLIEEYSAGRNVVFIIDEAQNMPVVTLEHLRMLSNLETSTDKLIQIVLIGQPELEHILNRHELRQLKQRIAIFATINPLTDKESFEYIKFRLTKALRVKTPVFTKGAANAIVRAAKGIPRSINIIADNALITGFGAQRKPVTTKIIREVISDFRPDTKSKLRWAIAALATVIIIAAALIAFSESSFEDFLATARSQISQLERVTGANQPPPAASPTVDRNPEAKANAAVSDETKTAHLGDKIAAGHQDESMPTKSTVGKDAAIQTATKKASTPVQEKIPKTEPGEESGKSDADPVPTLENPESGRSSPGHPEAPANLKDESFTSRSTPGTRESTPGYRLDYVNQSVADIPEAKDDTIGDSVPKASVEASNKSARTLEVASLSGSDPHIGHLMPTDQAASIDTRQSTIVRTVKKGDSLIRITAEVYNVSSDEVCRKGLLDTIIRLNPQIQNINRIEVGEKIVFPLPKTPGKAE